MATQPTNRIRSGFIELGKRMLEKDEHLEAVIHRTSIYNNWFTKEEIYRAIDSIATEYLEESKLTEWVSQYAPYPGEEKVVAIIMAGNIPLVGFHDFLVALNAGHRVQVKLSEKDPYLFPWIVKTLIDLDPIFSEKIEVVDRIKDFQVVIATGSNNSSKYFHEYFKNYPHIIRKNRNGVAILNGDERHEDLHLLSKDIFNYFGMGCRNVSKLYVPQGYDFTPFVKAISHFEDLCNHNKYRNNLDYNAAMFILNRQPIIRLPHLILLEDQSISSRIGVLNYSFYNNEMELSEELKSKQEEIQCIVSKNGQLLHGIETYTFGKAQKPSLSDFADGVDTMKFLIQL